MTLATYPDRGMDMAMENRMMKAMFTMVQSQLGSSGGIGRRRGSRACSQARLPNAETPLPGCSEDT